MPSHRMGIGPQRHIGSSSVQPLATSRSGFQVGKIAMVSPVLYSVLSAGHILGSGPTEACGHRSFVRWCKEKPIAGSTAAKQIIQRQAPMLCDDPAVAEASIIGKHLHIFATRFSYTVTGNKQPKVDYLTKLLSGPHRTFTGYTYL